MKKTRSKKSPDTVPLIVTLAKIKCAFGQYVYCTSILVEAFTGLKIIWRAVRKRHAGVLEDPDYNDMTCKR
jgi:hypothetical protein